LGIIVFFVDLGKSRKEQDRYVEEERLERLAMADDLEQKIMRYPSRHWLVQHCLTTHLFLDDITIKHTSFTPIDSESF